MRESGECRPRNAVPLAGALLAFVVFLLVLNVWRGPCGYDVYYYALQTKALTLYGELLFFDFSLVYYVLYLINLPLRNPVLSVQVLSSLSMAAIYYCLLKMSLRRGFSLYKTAAASIALFNPASFYLLLEFTKNSFALALFFLSSLLLSGGLPGRRGPDRRGFLRFLPSLGGRTLWGLLFGLLAFFSHRVMLVLTGLLFLHRFTGGLWEAGYRIRRPLKLFIAGGGLVLALLGVIFWRDFFSSRMPPLDLDAPLRRLLLFNSRRLWPGERIFYTLSQLLLFFLVPPALIRRPFAPAAFWGFLAWLFVFPFLRFSWDETAFRLLIMAPLFAAPWLMERNLKAFSVPAGIFLLAGCVLFSAGAVARLARSKGPDYAVYQREFASLESLAAGRRIIAHRGLAGFLWYEKGIRSENFVPPAEEEAYLRLVYFFSPRTLEPYVQSGEERPIALGSYTLVEESVWQRFYRDRGDIVFFRSELNPDLPRPASGFSINEKTALFMSPVSAGP
jgi:hypothetical protein